MVLSGDSEPAVAIRHAYFAPAAPETRSMSRLLRQAAARARTLHTAFTALDKNGSNTLDKGELGSALAMLGRVVSARELDTLWTQVDINRDGELSFAEFAAFIGKQLRETGSQRRLQAAFRRFEILKTAFDVLDRDGRCMQPPRTQRGRARTHARTHAHPS